MNLCCLCFSNSINIGEIFAGHDLIEHEGVFKIVDGHDELIRFPATPLIDPLDGMTDEQEEAAFQIPEIDEQAHKFMSYVENFRTEYFSFHPQTGAMILDRCKSIGYNPETNGWLEYWLVNHVGKMIQHHRSTQED